MVKILNKITVIFLAVSLFSHCWIQTEKEKCQRNNDCDKDFGAFLMGICYSMRCNDPVFLSDYNYSSEGECLIMKAYFCVDGYNYYTEEDDKSDIPGSGGIYN